MSANNVNNQDTIVLIPGHETDVFAADEYRILLRGFNLSTNFVEVLTLFYSDTRERS